MFKSIIPECYVDTCLMNVLLQASEKNGVNHGKGKTTVTGKMNTVFSDKFCIGILDKDEEKRRVKFLDDFTAINEKVSLYSVLYKHKQKPHYIIELFPESETWICNVARTLNIDLESDKYKLSNTPQGLSKFTKNVSSIEDIRLINLFKEINKTSEQTNFEPVLKLKRWLRLLIDDNYKVDVKELEK